MLMVKVESTEDVALGVGEDTAKELATIVQEYSVNDLLRTQNLLVNLEQKIRDGFDPRINLELTLLKLVNMESSVTLEEVIAKIAAAGSSNPVAKPGPMAETKKKELKLTSPAPKEPEVKSKPTAATPPPGDLDLQNVWESFLQGLKRDHRNLQIKLSMAEPRRIVDGKLLVAFDQMGEFHVRQLEERDIRLLLEEHLRRVSGYDLKMRFYVDKDLRRQQNNERVNNLFLESERDDHPMIAEAIKVFDAKVVGRKDLPGQ
jgi:DNA polymerase III gamma/tau subunit